MPRYALLFAALIATMTLASGGCRNCSSCHDYDPPVANCNCDAYGTHRAGSACGGGCSGCSECSGGNCSTCNGGGQVEGEMSDGGYPSGGHYTEGLISE
jgi:hypothetical protein